MLWQFCGYISVSKYARILTMTGFWISKRYIGFKICHNMSEYVWKGRKYAWICSEFPETHRVYLFSKRRLGFEYMPRCNYGRVSELFQDSDYARFLHMWALLKVLNMFVYGWIMPEQTVQTMTGFWICLVKVSQSFEYASGSKSAEALGIWRGCENTRVTQGAKYAWIACDNKLEYARI